MIFLFLRWDILVPWRVNRLFNGWTSCALFLLLPLDPNQPFLKMDPCMAISEDWMPRHSYDIYNWNL